VNDLLDSQYSSLTTGISKYTNLFSDISETVGMSHDRILSEFESEKNILTEKVITQYSQHKDKVEYMLKHNDMLEQLESLAKTQNVMDIKNLLLYEECKKGVERYLKDD